MKQFGADHLVRPRFSAFLEISIASATFAVLAVFGYIVLFEMPYLGFLFDPPDGLMTVLDYGSNLDQYPRSGDFLEEINDVAWRGYPAEQRYSLLRQLGETNEVSLRIRRGQEIIPVLWVVPGINLTEFLYRLVSAWWLPFAFWLAGVATILLVRPKDARWKLLLSMFFLLAIAVSAGVISPYGFFYSPNILRSMIWVLLPVTWHLHWLFPRSLGTPPSRILWLLYGIAGIMVLAEWAGFLPSRAYLAGFLLILINSLALLALHAAVQPDKRRSVAILLLGILLTTLPTLVAVIYALVYRTFPAFVDLAVMLLPGIAVTYFYIIYRGDADGMEVRSNRLITVMIYGGMLLVIAVILAFIAGAVFEGANYHPSIEIALAFLLGMVTLFFYPPFQRWIDRRLLGIPVPPTQLLERYSTRVTTSLGLEDLVYILQNEALPSMLIRQAALIRLDSANVPSPVFTTGIDEDQLPLQEDIQTLISQAGDFPRLDPRNEFDNICPWAYLILTLSASGQEIGICLLGKRDPDDVYTKSDVRVLQALMDQTALALVNIDQAERLRALYQKDIERQEMERSHLARELHDDVLNQLGMLWMSVDERQAGERFAEAYQTSVTRIREIISGLRPGMLMYGLRFALEELTEETATQVGGDIAIQLEVPPSDCRYPPDVELHLFRIVQQACQNALQHSQAQCIYLRGELDPSKAELVVEDDGIGFVAGKHLDLARLLANKHYGLAGMHERAALIGAQMQIDSSPGEGTRVRVRWNTASPTSLKSG